jgi:hypothetical protein
VHFPWPTAVVVDNARHPRLPQTAGQGLLIFSFASVRDKAGIRLAWMPLRGGGAPHLQDTQYFAGLSPDREPRWSPDADAADVLVTVDSHYTHMSAIWLEGPQRWILLYSLAYDDAEHPDKGPSSQYTRPIVARVGTTLWNWSDMVPVFEPLKKNAAGEYAYGSYMHNYQADPTRPHDDINRRPPPSQAGKEHDSWAYGPFIIDRFTRPTWDPEKRELDLYYLLSFSSPYQVQLMSTRLRVD